MLLRRAGVPRRVIAVASLSTRVDGAAKDSESRLDRLRSGVGEVGVRMRQFSPRQAWEFVRFGGRRWRYVAFGCRLTAVTIAAAWFSKGTHRRRGTFRLGVTSEPLSHNPFGKQSKQLIV